jgi:ABC-type dipeptide/oligopeptide/nickel transport system ATPase component
MTQSFTFGLKTYRSYFQQATTKLTFTQGEVIALVGANNSGKSCLIRSIYELRNYFQHLCAGNVSNQGTDFINWGNQGGPMFLGVADPLDLVPEVNLVKDKSVVFEIETEEWLLRFALIGDQLQSWTQHFQLKTPNHSDSLFIGPYRNISNQTAGGGTTHYDLPIGEAFVAQWRRLKTGTNRLAKLAVMNTQRDIASLLGYTSLEISASEDSKTLSLVFDGNRIMSLGDVGAGIAQLIFSIVTVADRAPQIILIDEPELHLHPTMQARFVEALHRHAKYATVFATHSLGLARQAANTISVVSQNRVTGKSTITPFESARNSAQLLGELSYSQFSAIGGRFLLLVEGSTEVRTFRVLLRKLGIETDVMIVPLGGSSLIGANRREEMTEFQRIGAEVFVLIDSERNAETDPLDAEHEGFFQICSDLFGSEQTFLTKRKATENYLSDRAVKAVKGENYRAIEHYERLASVEPAWAKNENWMIADEMAFDELKDTDLGEFLLKLQKRVSNSKLATTMAT